MQSEASSLLPFCYFTKRVATLYHQAHSFVIQGLSRHQSFRVQPLEFCVEFFNNVCVFLTKVVEVCMNVFL